MRQLLLAAAAAALLVIPAAASSATKVYYPGCAATDYKPKNVVVACGDGNFQLRKMKWSAWGASSATGSGNASANTCEPNCAEGKFKNYAATVKLTRPKTCKDLGVKVFTRLEVDFKSSKPAGYKSVVKQKLACPTVGQQQG
jgi:hypothetical protein